MAILSHAAIMLLGIQSVLGQISTLTTTSRTLITITAYSCVPEPTGTGESLTFNGPNEYINTYVVTYLNICIDGSASLCPFDYTLSQICTSSSICTPPTGIPSGFTVTQKPCGCAENTLITVTEPCPATATARTGGFPSQSTPPDAVGQNAAAVPAAQPSLQNVATSSIMGANPTVADTTLTTVPVAVSSMASNLTSISGSDVTPASASTAASSSGGRISVGNDVVWMIMMVIFLFILLFL